MIWKNTGTRVATKIINTKMLATLTANRRPRLAPQENELPISKEPSDESKGRNDDLLYR